MLITQKDLPKQIIKGKKKGNNVNSKEIFERDYGSRDWNWYCNLVAECIRYGMPGKWCDLGAGLGLFVECATRFGIDCIGLEGSEYGVRKAKERYPDMEIRQYFLEDPLPFEDKTISTIMCHQVIEHLQVETTKIMLKECYRVLKPGGCILIYSPNKYNRKAKLDETHINLYTPRLLKKELENIGFQIIRTPNSPKMILGDPQIAKYIMWAVFKLFPLDHLTASSNCIAIKPDVKNE